MVRTKNNGHDIEAADKIEKILVDRLESRMFPEGLPDPEDMEVETGYGDMPIQQKLGVLQRMITAVSEKSEYLQVLLLAAFDDKHEALLAADAITERQRYGVDIQPIINRVVAQCAVHAERVNTVINAYSSFTLHTNNYKGNKPDWKKEQDKSAI